METDILLIWASGGKNQSVQRAMMENQTKALEELKQAYQTPAQQPVQQASLQDKLNELVALKQQGFLSDEEFEEKRKEMISRI